MEQLSLPVKGRGGWRPGAGRPKKKIKGVPHLVREEFAKRFPVHVTWRVRREIGSLRTEARFSWMKHAFWAGSERFGMRLIEFSVQDDHVHLIVEAEGRESLRRGMQGLAIRVAKAINRARRKHGKVFSDRYHSRVLRSPTEVKHAVHYVRTNWHKHMAKRGVRVDWSRPDRFSSGCLEAVYEMAISYDGETIDVRILPTARTWILRRAVAPPGRS